MLRNNKQKPVLQFIGLILASVMCLTGCGKETEKPAEQQVELLTFNRDTYKTAQVIKGNYQKVSSGSASMIYLLHSNLYWEGNEVCFTECLVKSGQKVKQGDELMRFESEADQVQLEKLRIQLERIQEDFEEENARMLEELHAAKIKSEELKDADLTIAELKIEKQQAKYEQFLYEHEKEIRRIEKQIAELKEEAKADVLTAPYDGVVEDVARLYEGDMVSKGQWLVKLYSADKVLFRADKATDKLRYNMDVTLETGKNDTLKSYQGKVVVSPNVLPLSLSQDLVLIQLDQEIDEEQFKGSIRYRGVSEEVQEILMVERKAIHREDNQEYVYVLDGDMIRKRYVETALDSTEGVWIVDGLEEGQTIVVN